MCGYGWISDSAEVFGDAWVSGNIHIFSGVRLISGIWNRNLQIGHKHYAVSTTLRRVLIS